MDLSSKNALSPLRLSKNKVYTKLELYVTYFTVFFGGGGASLVAQTVKNLTTVHPWVMKISWRRERQPIPVFSPGEFHGQTLLLKVNKGIKGQQRY